ncbi:MAG TPA: CoA transferase [Gemmatimonadaceae bacterium]|nr:CoA transferase [Gemmatimonadaceae bacterium]
MSLPLNGVRVVDISRVLAGPLAAMTLGDLGADVIKIERPSTGDESRGWGPPFDSRGESAYYLCCNRNKLSVAADLDDPRDQAWVRQLIAGADVVLDNFKSGTLEKRGLDPALLLANHPRLVWCTITGFGAQSARPGYDFVVQAESGWMSITGEVDGAPMKAGVALVDVITGKDAAIAILAALAGGRAGAPARRRLTVSLQHSATSALINVAQNSLVTGRDARRWGNAHANLVPYELFEASDRPLVIAVGSDAQFAALAGALELDALRDPRFATNAGRLAHRAEIVPAIRARVATRAAAGWIARLEAAGVPCGVVRTVLEALGDTIASELSGVAPLAPGSVRRNPPTLDEHGALVRAHGWDAFARA